MVNVTDQDVVDALHLDSVSDLPSGYAADIEAAEDIVGVQVEPHTDESALVHQCAVFVACAFITGTEGDAPVSSLERESASVSFDTDASSDEAVDYWERAKAFDPTGRLGQSAGSSGSLFEVY